MELIFPSRCPVCDGLLEWTESLIGNGRGVHSQCQERLKPVRTPFCHHCGKTVLSEQQEYCEDCLKKSAFYFRQGRALFVYEREMKTSMYRYKYQNRRCYAKFFTQRAVQNYRDWIERICPDVIVPVPMFAKKKRKRGYNQAEVFAKELSKVLHIPCRTNLIQRVRNTRPMKELDDEKREKNLQNAFQIHHADLLHNIFDRHQMKIVHPLFYKALLQLLHLLRFVYYLLVILQFLPKLLVDCSNHFRFLQYGGINLLDFLYKLC